ncbi:fungal-specific transcription factor domain-containing protein [Aspergillus aurantiobrunneus]
MAAVQANVISARSPRSRRNRPCDFCRFRKVACKISSPGPPCELCVAKQQACTFEQAPQKRRRLRTSVSPAPVDLEAPGADPLGYAPDLATHGVGPAMNLDNEIRLDHDLAEINGLDFTQAPAQRPPDGEDYRWQDVIHAGSSIPPMHPATTPASASSNPQRPLPSPLMRFVGSSGDLDTHLLAHRQYDAQNQSVSKHTHLVYQRLQNLESTLAESKPPPMLTLCRDPSLSRGHEITDPSSFQDARQEVHQLLNIETVARLAALFARFVHPYLPIISKKTLTTQSSLLFDAPALLAAIAATAGHFVAYDDVLCLKSSSCPSPRRLYQLCWQLLQEDLATPRLSTVQVLILLLHRHLPDELSLEGSMDSNLRGLLVSSTYSLGLNRDPTDWDTLPAGQRKLRRCLWWAAWVTEKWMAFSDGMPSQYHRDEYDVSPMQIDDIVALDDRPTALSPFVYLNQLTFILDDINRSFFSLAAADHTSSSFPISLELARNLRQRLKTWFDGLPDQLQPHRRSMTDADEVDESELGGHFSLNLAYMTAQLAIYRALIRPVSLVALQCHTWHHSPLSLDIDLNAAEAVVEGALSNTRSLVSSLTTLTAAEWDSFWPGWSRHNFASISTLLLHLYLLTARFQGWPLNTPSSQPGTCFLVSQFEKVQALMPKWRWHLILASRGAGGRKGLTNLALLRLDALMNEWKAGSPIPAC